MCMFMAVFSTLLLLLLRAKQWMGVTIAIAMTRTTNIGTGMQHPFTNYNFNTYRYIHYTVPVHVRVYPQHVEYIHSFLYFYYKTPHNETRKLFAIYFFVKSTGTCTRYVHIHVLLLLLYYSSATLLLYYQYNTTCMYVHYYTYYYSINKVRLHSLNY